MVLDYRKEGRIAYFVLNRPQKYNALNPDMMRSLEATMNDFMKDARLRVGILTGAGDKAFCAGADVEEWLPFVKASRDKPELMPRTILRGQQVDKPLIAALNGICFGGGGELALACDIRIACEKTLFRWPEASLGILPRLGGTQRLPRLVGQARALEILMTAREVTAQEALAIGLVNKLVEEEELLAVAEEYANKFLEMAPLALQAIKKCVYIGSNLTLDEGLGLENVLGFSLYDTEDYLEGVTAAREKRRSNFQAK